MTSVAGAMCFSTVCVFFDQPGGQSVLFPLNAFPGLQVTTPAKREPVAIPTDSNFSGRKSVRMQTCLRGPEISSTEEQLHYPLTGVTREPL